MLLSTLAIILYYTLFPPEPPKVEENRQTEVATEVEQGKAGQTEAGKAVKRVENESATEPGTVITGGTERKTVSVDSSLYSIKIDSLNGTLQEFLLKEYKYSLEPHFSITDFVVSLFTGKEDDKTPYDPNRLVDMAGDVSEKNLIWNLTTGPDGGDVNFAVEKDKIDISSVPEQLVMTAILPSGIEAYKTLTFHPDSYVIDMDVKLVNRTGEPQTVSPRINFGAGNEAIDDETLPQPKEAVAFVDEDFEKYDGGDVEDTLNVKNTLWAGVMDKYFLNVVKMENESLFDVAMNPIQSKLNGDEITVPQVKFAEEPIRLSNNEEYARSFKLYVGPKVESRLENFDYYLPQAMDLGWFEVLARPLLGILRWLQSYVVNWGVAIILLTIIVRTAMLPLAYKSMISMRKMQLLNPKIQKIREKYKGSKEKMNQEVMKFYSQNKVNPMGGCLPMALQIPIFIALYQALLPAIELRHTPFMLWWSDLSAADYTMVLPLLMGASMFLQQSLTPTPAMDPTQAKIMKFMPVMMIIFFLNMPSGLVLYWVVSNIISIGQQLIFNKVSPRPEPESTDKKSGNKKATDKKSGDKKTADKKPAKGSANPAKDMSGKKKK